MPDRERGRALAQGIRSASDRPRGAAMASLRPRHLRRGHDSARAVWPLLPVAGQARSGPSALDHPRYLRRVRSGHSEEGQPVETGLRRPAARRPDGGTGSATSRSASSRSSRLAVEKRRLRIIREGQGETQRRTTQLRRARPATPGEEPLSGSADLSARSRLHALREDGRPPGDAAGDRPHDALRRGDLLAVRRAREARIRGGAGPGRSAAQSGRDARLRRLHKRGLESCAGDPEGRRAALVARADPPGSESSTGARKCPCRRSSGSSSSRRRSAISTESFTSARRPPFPPPP